VVNVVTSNVWESMSCAKPHVAPRTIVRDRLCYTVHITRILNLKTARIIENMYILFPVNIPMFLISIYFLYVFSKGFFSHLALLVQMAQSLRIFYF
jgi:hypothetical protein